MKKIFYLAIAALAFAACARELAPEAESNLPKVKVSIKAILEQEDVTKAEINMSNGTASWESGDQIAVHTKNGKLATLEAESAGTSVTFSGTVDAGDDIEDGAIAYYPAAIAIEGAANIDKISLPASYASPALSAKGFPMRGVLTGDAVEFKHIGGLMKVSVNDVPSEVTSLVFTAASVAVSGELDVDATAPKCVVGSASSSITISSAAADRAAGTAVFYIPLPTGVLAGGFSLALKNGSDDVYVKTSTNALEITRAKLFKMKTFAPEGAASGWFLAGKFNGWSTTDTPMTEVIDHTGWVVARNITLPNEDTEKGFKFFNSGTWKGGDCSALHTQFDANLDSNIDFTHGQSYDIYYNHTTNKFFLANAGEPWIYKTIYLMSDMDLSDLTYYLHIWPHSGSGLNTTWPGIQGSKVSLSGIPYYKFEVAICDGDFTSNSYDCIFSDGKTPGENPTVRYEFGSGALTADAVNDVYYASFTSSKYNGYVSGSTNDMTQFTDPAHPNGKSNWYLLLDRATYKPMSWNDSPELVVKNVTIGPSTTLMFRYTQGSHSSNIFYFHDGSVDANSNLSVSFNPNGSRSSGPVFTIPSLTGDTVCDVYLDVINSKAKIVPIAQADANATLYFRLLDKSPEHAYLYAWQGGSTPSWEIGSFPGQEMTSEVIDGIKYYKIALPISKVWDAGTKLIVSDGSWKTDDFTSADWSGRKDAYYFSVAASKITQTTESDIAFNLISNFEGVSWNSVDWQTSDRSDYITAWKATSDDDYLYLYFLIDKSRIVKETYIYTGYDTDEGVTGGNAGGNITGKYNARTLIYPFKEADGIVVCRNNTGWDDYTECPVGTRVDGNANPPVSYGVIKSNYAYYEVKVSRTIIGATGANKIVGINHSMNYAVCGHRDITLK